MTHAKYRKSLPQLNGKKFLTDGGLETALIFHEGFELPLFASFVLLDDKEGRKAIDRYMRRFCNIAVRDQKGFIIDTPTWRASRDWAQKLGISEDKLKSLNARSVDYAFSLRDELETENSPFVVNGVIGPQGDGYNPESFLSAGDAEAYHSQQTGWFESLGVDMVSAITMTYVEEALGITRAAKKYSLPVVVSFTVETDGRLPSGQTLGSAIEQVDSETGSYPAYYMINCAHPDHFQSELENDNSWKKRIYGLRANASRMSHAELDNSVQLDDGDPVELGGQYKELESLLPNLVVIGGCCGTDHRHIDAMSSKCR